MEDFCVVFYLRILFSTFHFLIYFPIFFENRDFKISKFKKKNFKKWKFQKIFPQENVFHTIPYLFHTQSIHIPYPLPRSIHTQSIQNPYELPYRIHTSSILIPCKVHTYSTIIPWILKWHLLIGHPLENSL